MHPSHKTPAKRCTFRQLRNDCVSHYIGFITEWLKFGLSKRHAAAADAGTWQCGGTHGEYKQLARVAAAVCRCVDRNTRLDRVVPWLHARGSCQIPPIALLRLVASPCSDIAPADKSLSMPSVRPTNQIKAADLEGQQRTQAMVAKGALGSVASAMIRHGPTLLSIRSVHRHSYQQTQHFRATPVLSVTWSFGADATRLRFAPDGPAGKPVAAALDGDADASALPSLSSSSCHNRQLAA